MSARLKAYLFFRHHLAELADTLRFMHLQRCALSLSMSKAAVEKSKEDLSDAYRAYDDALAEYRLHQEVAVQSDPIRVVQPLTRKDLQWMLPSKPSK